MVPMCTMLPPPPSRITGATCWLIRSGPSRFTEKTFCQYSSVISLTVTGAGLMPALLTSTSMRPKRSTTFSTKPGMASQSPTWQARPSTSPPVAERISSATRSQSSCLRELTTTEAPAADSPSTMARPMPLVEPVTMATLPVRSNMLLSVIETFSLCRVTSDRPEPFDAGLEM